MKIINLFGGPSVGKSTIAAGLYYKFKMNNKEIELINEYAKELVFENRFDILSNDQLYIFAKQNRKVLRLKDKIDYLIMDSPLLLNLIYINKNSEIYDYKLYSDFVFNTFNKYENINIFLNRNFKNKFQDFGRMQNLNESIEIDNKILNLLEKYSIKYENILSSENSVQQITKMVLGDIYE